MKKILLTMAGLYLAVGAVILWNRVDGLTDKATWLKKYGLSYFLAWPYQILNFHD